MIGIRYSMVLLLAVGLLACGGSDTKTALVTDIDMPVSLSSLSENGNSSTFNSLLRSTEPLQSTRGVILLHGRGGNPDAAVVRQLRNDLAERGYTTLSVQEPVPVGFAEGSGSKPPFQNYIDDINGSNLVFPELYARVRSALNYLQQRGVQQVVLIGFSMGSRMATAHLANGVIDEIPIIGLVGVGMYANNIAPLNIALTIGQVNVPVLDIYGSLDTNAVTTALSRKTAYEGSGIGPAMTQLILTCSPGLTTNDCHKLVGLKGTSTSPLEEAVANWIAAL